MAGKMKKSFKEAVKKEEAYTKFPSPYGSHKSMVDESCKLANDKFVVCIDEFGPYVTERNRLDSGLADPHRHATAEWRREKLKKEGKNEV